MLIGDCRAILPTLDAETFDTVVVDPPFNAPPAAKSGGTTVRLKRWLRNDGQTYYDNDELSPEEFHDFFVPVLEQLNRVMEPGAHLYWFTSRWTLHRFEAYLSDPLYGFVLRNYVFWNKMHIGMGYYYRHQVEIILFLTKGKTKRFVQGTGNVIEEPRDKPSALMHPHQKPTGLYRKLYTASKSASVLDPFAGSGTSGIAAEEMGISYTGIELVDGWNVIKNANRDQGVLL